MKAAADTERVNGSSPGAFARDAAACRPFSRFLDTPFGPVAILWSVHDSTPRVLQVIISRPDADARSLTGTAFPGTAESSCPEVDETAGMMEAYLGGEDITFPLDPVRMDLVSPFQQRVLRAEHGIPRGSVSTYGRIAEHLGIPRASRAVGTALATNPFPLIIPCHRAIRSDGTLGGYQGGLDMKRALLRMEGVAFTDRGRVEGTRFHY